MMYSLPSTGSELSYFRIPYKAPVDGCTARSEMDRTSVPSLMGTLDMSAPVSGSMRIRSLGCNAPTGGGKPYAS